MDKINHIIKKYSQKNYEKRINFPYSQTAIIAFDAYKKYKSRYENILDKNKQDFTEIKSMLKDKYTYGSYSMLKNEKVMPKIISCLYYNNVLGISQLFDAANIISYGEYAKNANELNKTRLDDHEPSSLLVIEPTSDSVDFGEKHDTTDSDIDFEQEKSNTILDAQRQFILANNKTIKLTSRIQTKESNEPEANAQSSQSTADMSVVYNRDVTSSNIMEISIEKPCANDMQTENQNDFIECSKDSTQNECRNLFNDAELYKESLHSVIENKSCDEAIFKSTYKEFSQGPKEFSQGPKEFSQENENSHVESNSNTLQEQKKKASYMIDTTTTGKRKIEVHHDFMYEHVKKTLNSNAHSEIHASVSYFGLQIIKMRGDVIKVSNPFLFSVIYSVDVLYLNWCNILQEVHEVEKTIFLFEKYLTGEIYKSIVKIKQKKYIECLRQQDPNLNHIILEFVSSLFYINIIVIFTAEIGDIYGFYPKDKRFDGQKKTVFIIDGCPTYQCRNDIPLFFWNSFFKAQISYKTKLSTLREYMYIFNLNESIDSKNKRQIIDGILIPYINCNFPTE